MGLRPGRSGGGLAAVVGGLLVVAYGLAFPAYASAFLTADSNGGVAPPAGAEYALAFVYLVGSLLSFGGLLGLGRLVERRGALSVSATGRGGGLGGTGGRTGRVGRLSWAQRAGTVGLVLAVLAFLAALALLIDLLAFGPHVSMPWADDPRGPVLVAATLVLEVLRMLGLPLATVLLGVAVWRSGVLGRWGFLPVALGALSSPLMWALVFAGGYLVAGQDGMVVSSGELADLYFFGVPHLVAGLGWALLGWLLFSGRVEEGRESLLGG